tara:strand:- start:1254 stop:1694 length:441 start_codon:yes stop_codon:yes gene_type:complete
MNYATINDFDEVWNIFQENKKWFPHVRTSHVRNRLNWGQVILQDGVVITQQEYKKNGKIGKDSDVSVKKGDYIIHQIINSNPKNGNAKKVIEEYFDHVNQNVYLTVRSENIPANKFYEKVGMTKVGYINWSKGKMHGNVWLKRLDK